MNLSCFTLEQKRCFILSQLDSKIQKEHLDSRVKKKTGDPNTCAEVSCVYFYVFTSALEIVWHENEVLKT